MNRCSLLLSLLLQPFALLLAFSAQAQNPQDIIVEQVQSQLSSAASQQRINKLDDETQVMLETYRELQEKIEQLTQENQQREHTVGRQERQVSRLQQDITDTRRLLDQLDIFSHELQSHLLPLRQQIPYAPKDIPRSQTAALDSPQPTERFLASLDLWTQELDQSTRLYAWNGQLPNGKQVEFVRLGRVALYYLTPDNNDAAMFSPESGEWHPLSLVNLSDVVRARDIARGDRKPDWLYLPTMGIKREETL